MARAAGRERETCVGSGLPDPFQVDGTDL